MDKKRHPRRFQLRGMPESEDISRLKRAFLVLCIAVLLLAVLGVGLAGTVSKLVRTLQIIMEQLQFIIQQIDEAA